MKQNLMMLWRKWKQTMEDSLEAVRRRIYRAKGSHASYEEFYLTVRLEEKLRNLGYLQYQLAQARAEATDLRQKEKDYPEKFASIFQKTDDDLRQAAKFDVQKSVNGKSWTVVTAHCCLGGCDMGVYPFRTEREALIYAALLQATEYHPPHNHACHSCYQRYMRDCI